MTINLVLGKTSQQIHIFLFWMTNILNDKGFDDGLLTGMILTGLQKAFDMVNQDIIWQIMDNWFLWLSCQWFQSYLSNYNYLQGSILGPLLFLIYINSLLMAVKCDIFLYADDTCLVFQRKNVKDIEKQLNEDFAKICKWFVNT